MKHLDEHIEEMRSFGEFLVPYNYPQVTQNEEEDVNYIKAREAIVDGYSLILHYSKADYGNHYLETLQILSKYCPFLPFSLVCKIGKKFLGDKHLSLVEIFRDNRKIYCWTIVVDKNGNPVSGPHQEELEVKSYEGFEYHSMRPEQVNFH